MKERIKGIAILLFFIVVAFVYHHKYINEFPSHIHAWAQSDRYALSLGFLDNGLNFFKPQTFVYNHQFPDKWEVPSEYTITAVNFPIHDYIPALLMKVTGSTSPWVFRMYILLYSFLGLFFLFKLTFSITKDYVKSAFAVLFAATSPVFVYYQAGFLPTIPSLSNAIIGIFFYYKYLCENRNKHFWFSLMFLTLAALSRTTFAIPIVAVLSVEFIRIIRKESNFVAKILPVTISALILLSYMLYNGYLRNLYGSIFLNYLLPAESFEQVEETLKYIYHNWIFQYFSIYHYLIFIIFTISGIVLLIRRKTKLKKPKIYFGLLIGSYLCGCILFFFFMLQQFPAHDYYFIDTFYLPLNLLLILLLVLIPKTEKRGIRIVKIAFLSIISFILLIQPIKSQKQRRETGPWDRTEITINNYNNASSFLDSIGISKSSKILVLDAVAPNIPFLLMQRKGYAVMHTKRENLERALEWNFDYIVIQNEYFISDMYTPYPAIINKLKKIADNGKISVCTLSTNLHQTLLDFIGLNEKKAIFERDVDFEKNPGVFWQNYEPTYQKSYSGSASGLLHPDILYGLTYKTNQFSELQEKSRTLLFSSYFLRHTEINCEIVVSIHENGQNIYYKSNNLEQLIQKQNEWQKVSLVFQLPKIESNDYEFALYLFNTGESTLYYDEFSISIY